MTNPPPLLQRLYLKGPLERFPQWVSSLHDLVRIRLKWSSLTRDNPIEALQDLQNLVELQLLDAYTGTQLVFKSEKFQKLKILDLQKLEQLTYIIMQEGTLPHLQKMIIALCSKLACVPIGIERCRDLQELHLCDMPQTFVTALEKNGGKFRHLVRHIPHIGSYKQGQLVEDLSWPYILLLWHAAVDQESGLYNYMNSSFASFKFLKMYYWIAIPLLPDMHIFDPIWNVMIALSQDLASLQEIWILGLQFYTICNS